MPRYNSFDVDLVLRLIPFPTDNIFLCWKLFASMIGAPITMGWHVCYSNYYNFMNEPQYKRYQNGITSELIPKWHMRIVALRLSELTKKSNNQNSRGTDKKNHKSVRVQNKSPFYTVTLKLSWLQLVQSSLRAFPALHLCAHWTSAIDTSMHAKAFFGTITEYLLLIQASVLTLLKWSYTWREFSLFTENCTQRNRCLNSPLRQCRIQYKLVSCVYTPIRIDSCQPTMDI